ncbi:MAG: hypothetical protein ACREBU_19690 [Nitrososphaera sp.]
MWQRELERERVASERIGERIIKLRFQYELVKRNAETLGLDLVHLNTIQESLLDFEKQIRDFLASQAN